MKKTLTTILGCIFFAIFFFMMFTTQYFTRHRSASPQAARGWIYPASANYYKTVYVTAEERTVLLFTGEWGCLALFAICGVVIWVTKKKDSNSGLTTGGR